MTYNRQRKKSVSVRRTESPSSVLSRKDPERLMPLGLSSRDVALPPSVWPSPYRSNESWVGMLLDRLMLGPGRLYWDIPVGLTEINTERERGREREGGDIKYSMRDMLIFYINLMVEIFTYMFSKVVVYSLYYGGVLNTF